MIEQLANRISKGVVSDIDKSIFPADAGYKFENAEITSEGNNYIVSSTKGNKFQFELPEELTPFGFYEYDEILYILSFVETDNGRYYEVGSYPSPALTVIVNPNPALIHNYTECYLAPENDDIELEDVYRQLPAMRYSESGTDYILGFSSKNISFNENYVNIISKVSYDKTLDLYICDGENYNRTINSGFSHKKIFPKRYVDVDLKDEHLENITRQFLAANKPVFSDFEVKQGGTLPYGRLVFYMRYLDVSLNHTNFIPIHDPIQISYGTKYWDIHGGAPEHDIPTDKKVSLSLRNLNTAFKYFEIAVFYERGIAGTTDPVKKAYLISNHYDIESSEMDLVVTGNEDQEVITPEELIMPAKEQTISLSQTNHNKRWFGANWKRQRFNTDVVKELAKMVYLKPTLADTPIVNERTKDREGDAFLLEFEDDDLLRSQDPKFPGTFFPGEVAAFALVALLDDGTYSKPYPITGYNNFYAKRDFPGLGWVENNLETAVSVYGSGFDLDAKMRNWLSNDNKTNEGLYQFPMFNTNYTGEYFSGYHHLEKLRYPLAMKLQLKYAIGYFNEHRDEFEGVNGFYLVKTETEKNATYMGISYWAHDRYVFTADNTDDYHKYWFVKYGRKYFNNSYYSVDGSYSFINENDNDYISNQIPFSGEYAMLCRNTEDVGSRGYFGIGHTDIDVRTMGAPRERTKYGLFSDDFILSEERPLLERESMIVGFPFKSYFTNRTGLFETYPGQLTSAIEVVPGMSIAPPATYYPQYTGIVNYIEKDTQNKEGFYSAIGDQIFSTDLKAIVFDDVSIRVIESSNIDSGLRNPEIRTSPYLGIEMTCEPFTDMFYNMIANEYLILHKTNPTKLYNDKLNDLKESKFINYYIVSKFIDFNDNTLPDGVIKYNGIDTHYFGIYIYGDAFMSRSFIKTRYNELFKDFDYGFIVDNAEDWGNKDQQIKGMHEYLKWTHELLSFPTITWNNIHMQSDYKKNFYPNSSDKKKKKEFIQGYLRNEKDMGIDPILDGSYNRSYLPNQLLRYPDNYREQFDFSNRVYYTAQHLPGSYIDSWRYSPASQYEEFDASIGIITAIASAFMNLYLIFENGILEIYSDKREVQQSNTGAELTIGVGGVLEKTYRALTKEYGSQSPEISVNDLGVFGCSYKHNVLWKIGLSQSEYKSSSVQINDLTASNGIVELFKNSKSNLSTVTSDISNFGSKMMVRYSRYDKRVYFVFYDRKWAVLDGDLVGRSLYRFYTDNYMLMGRDGFYARLEGEDVYEFYEILPENVGENYVDVEIPNASGQRITISVFDDNGFTLVYDNKIGAFYQQTNTPNHMISGEYIREMHYLPDNNTNEVFIRKDAEPLEFFNIRHEMRIGVIINGAQSEKGIGPVQKMFMSSLVLSSEDVFFRAIFETEFQKSMLFPFYDESRFWLLPEYAENKWEFNHPVQTSDIDEGYEPDAQMRGVWLMMELHYRGMYKKYINEIITKVSPSYS